MLLFSSCSEGLSCLSSFFFPQLFTPYAARWRTIHICFLVGNSDSKDKQYTYKISTRSSILVHFTLLTSIFITLLFHAAVLP